MSVMLELRSVEKRYDNGTLALERVNLAVCKHEFVSLLGPSGCGESTALKMIAGLAKFAHVYPRELSGGMKLWVAIARATVTEPRLLLMDEPFAALDEMTRFKLNSDTLALWQAQQYTTIFVTRSVYKSMYLSNRVIVMAARPGRVIADIAVEARYPRTDSFRNTSRYAELCVQGSQALQKAGDHHD